MPTTTPSAVVRSSRLLLRTLAQRTITIADEASPFELAKLIYSLSRSNVPEASEAYRRSLRTLVKGTPRMPPVAVSWLLSASSSLGCSTNNGAQGTTATDETWTPEQEEQQQQLIAALTARAQSIVNMAEAKTSAVLHPSSSSSQQPAASSSSPASDVSFDAHFGGSDGFVDGSYDPHWDMDTPADSSSSSNASSPPMIRNLPTGARYKLGQNDAVVLRSIEALAGLTRAFTDYQQQTARARGGTAVKNLDKSSTEDTIESELLGRFLQLYTTALEHAPRIARSGSDPRRIRLNMLTIGAELVNHLAVHRSPSFTYKLFTDVVVLPLLAYYDDVVSESSSTGYKLADKSTPMPTARLLRPVLQLLCRVLREDLAPTGPGSQPLSAVIQDADLLALVSVLSDQSTMLLSGAALRATDVSLVVRDIVSCPPVFERLWTPEAERTISRRIHDSARRTVVDLGAVLGAGSAPLPGSPRRLKGEREGEEEEDPFVVVPEQALQLTDGICYELGCMAAAAHTPYSITNTMDYLDSRAQYTHRGSVTRSIGYNDVFAADAVIAEALCSKVLPAVLPTMTSKSSQLSFPQLVSTVCGVWNGSAATKGAVKPDAAYITAVHQRLDALLPYADEASTVRLINCVVSDDKSKVLPVEHTEGLVQRLINIAERDVDVYDSTGVEATQRLVAAVGGTSVEKLQAALDRRK